MLSAGEQQICFPVELVHTLLKQVLLLLTYFDWNHVLKLFSTRNDTLIISKTFQSKSCTTAIDFHDNMINYIIRIL